MNRRLRVPYWALVGSLLATAACGKRVPLGERRHIVDAGPPRVDASSVVTPDASPATDASSACQPVTCGGKGPYECGDCIDNDQDGQIDAADLDCLGPCDDTEDSLFGGIPGQSGGGCRLDCYFDNDSGSGNDGCEWHQGCDPLSKPPNYYPSGQASCALVGDGGTPSENQVCKDLSGPQSAQCLDTCLPLVPNGCDCFGCCELPARSGNFVYIGATDGMKGTCELDRLDDPEACPPCTPVESCQNLCEGCEVCVGQTESNIDCMSNESACPPSRPACTVEQSACGQYRYCITGCCVDVPR